MQPRDQMSISVPKGAPKTTSGALYGRLWTYL